VLFAQATGGSPIDASRRIQALCQFGTAYEAQLWTALSPGELKTTLEGAATAGRSAYGAAGTLTGQREPWNPGADWHPIATAAAAMIRADPLGYVWARLSLIPPAYRDSARLWTVLANAKPSWPLDPWQVFALLYQVYRSVLFGSFSLFVVLLVVALWNGWRFAEAVAPMRLVVVPLLVSIWASTAMLSLSDYEIRRLGLPAHPLIALVWALVIAHVLGRKRDVMVSGRAPRR
jgi:hypothetical protein